MITYADLIAAHPEAKAFPEAKVAPWIDVANSGLPDGRFKRDPDRARMLFVMHHLTNPAKGAAPVAVPRRSIRAATSNPAKKAPHQWRGTVYGERLISASKY